VVLSDPLSLDDLSFFEPSFRGEEGKEVPPAAPAMG
jgi:hypothetical protein